MPAMLLCEDLPWELACSWLHSSRIPTDVPKFDMALSAGMSAYLLPLAPGSI